VQLFNFDLFFESGLFQDIGGCAEHCDDNVCLNDKSPVDVQFY